MTNVDQFESVFRSAAKEVYVPRPVDVRRVLLLHDLEGERLERFTAELVRFLDVLGEECRIEPVAAGRSPDLDALLEETLRIAPDLVCTYRGLQSGGWSHPYSLGERLDVLTQATPFPVLVVPHPLDERAWPGGAPVLDRVMALTDHLSADARLVDWARRFAKEGSVLLLTHVEDERTFERYIDAVSKVPALPTDTARDELRERLLKEPADYIESCRQALLEAGQRVDVRGIVRMGRRLAEIRALVGENDVDLVVMNTKDDEQLAMHGLAYPLAVELRDVAILML